MSVVLIKLRLKSAVTAQAGLMSQTVRSYSRRKLQRSALVLILKSPLRISVVAILNLIYAKHSKGFDFFGALRLSNLRLAKSLYEV